MIYLKSYLYLGAIVGIFTVSHVLAEVAVTMTSEWKFNEPIIITGDNLDGDDTYYNELCISSAVNKANLKCYEPDDNSDGLIIEKWNENNLIFNAPADIPVQGVVTLKIRTTVQKCFGSAGCNEYTEELKREIGNYKAVPFATDLIDVATGKNVFELKSNTTYKVKGAFFGDEKGVIFMQTSNSAKALDTNNILSWSYNEITFKTPLDVELVGFSINNGIVATKYNLLSRSSSSSSSSSESKGRSSKSSLANQAITQLFSDTSDEHPYINAIKWAKEAGILQGYPDGTFQPDRTVNRAEFLKIVLAARGGTVNDGSDSAGFKDVDDNAWYAPYIRYAKKQGFIQGYSNGTFKPDQTVNFAEALKMAYSALGIFTNESGGNWYDRYLQHAQLNSVLYSNSAVIDGGMSRKDVVWIVWKLMTHSGEWRQVNVSSPTEILTSINEDTDAVLEAHCKEEWGNDANIVSYCEKNQRDAVKTLNLGKPSDITADQFSIIRTQCKKEWPEDYQMRAYCEKGQFEGVRDISENMPNGISQSEYDIIKNECLSDWPTDYKMQAYCEKKQYDAVRTLNATNMSASVRSRCASDWPRDFAMRVYCEKQ